MGCFVDLVLVIAQGILFVDFLSPARGAAGGLCIQYRKEDQERVGENTRADGGTNYGTTHASNIPLPHRIVQTSVLRATHRGVVLRVDARAERLLQYLKTKPPK